MPIEEAIVSIRLEVVLLMIALDNLFKANKRKRKTMTNSNYGRFVALEKVQFPNAVVDAEIWELDEYNKLQYVWYQGLSYALDIEKTKADTQNVWHIQIDLLGQPVFQLLPLSEDTKRDSQRVYTLGLEVIDLVQKGELLLQQSKVFQNSLFIRTDDDYIVISPMYPNTIAGRAKDLTLDKNQMVTHWKADLLQYLIGILEEWIDSVKKDV